MPPSVLLLRFSTEQLASVFSRCAVREDRDECSHVRVAVPRVFVCDGDAYFARVGAAGMNSSRSEANGNARSWQHPAVGAQHGNDPRCSQG